MRARYEPNLTSQIVKLLSVNFPSNKTNLVRLTHHRNASLIRGSDINFVRALKYGQINRSRGPSGSRKNGMRKQHGVTSIPYRKKSGLIYDATVAAVLAFFHSNTSWRQHSNTTKQPAMLFRFAGLSQLAFKTLYGPSPKSTNRLQ